MAFHHIYIYIYRNLIFEYLFMTRNLRVYITNVCNTFFQQLYLLTNIKQYMIIDHDPRILMYNTEMHEQLSIQRSLKEFTH